ncbi:MAG: extracellular solute-binding protein [Deltaproteobacteria bacterium]|nr:extracellular solute-binding protein [Deltaproteobacteria bacterium]
MSPLAGRRLGLLVWAGLVPSLAVVGLASTGCKGTCRPGGDEVVIYTSVDQVFSAPVFWEFERRTGIRVRAVFDTEETKSTGVVNRLIAEAARPQADLFWSNDPVRQLLLVQRGLVEAYLSPNAAGIPPEFRSADGAWTGFAARARILLVNKELVPDADVPRSLRDLADPRWRGRFAIANPLFGTTTMHVAALFDAWGEAEARAFLDSLKANGVRIASSNGEVKRLVVAGEVAIGLCDTDDGNEALEEGAPVEIVYPDQDGTGTLVMPTTVVIIRGGPHPDAARRLVDYLLTAGVEQTMAEQAAHMPLRPGVPAPPGVRPVTGLRAMKVDYGRVATEMERIQPWLQEWVGL